MKRGRIWSRRGKILLLPLKGRRIWSGKEEGFGHEGARFRFCLLKEEGFGHFFRLFDVDDLIFVNDSSKID